MSSPVELFRFEDDETLVVLRLREVDRNPEGRVTQLMGEVAVETGFVSGSVPIYVGVPDDLTAWQGTLDQLDAGYDASWMENQRSAEVLVRWEDDELVEVTVRDRLATLTAVRVVVSVSEEWFERAYELLDRIYALGESTTA